MVSGRWSMVDERGLLTGGDDFFAGFWGIFSLIIPLWEVLLICVSENGPCVGQDQEIAFCWLACTVCPQQGIGVGWKRQGFGLDSGVAGVG